MNQSFTITAMPKATTRHTFAPHEDSFYESSESDSEDESRRCTRICSSTPSLIVALYLDMHQDTTLSMKDVRRLKPTFRQVPPIPEPLATNAEVFQPGRVEDNREDEMDRAERSIEAKGNKFNDSSTTRSHIKHSQEVSCKSLRVFGMFQSPGERLLDLLELILSGTASLREKATMVLERDYGYVKLGNRKLNGAQSAYGKGVGYGEKGVTGQESFRSA